MIPQLRILRRTSLQPAGICVSAHLGRHVRGQWRGLKIRRGSEFVPDSDPTQRTLDRSYNMLLSETTSAVRELNDGKTPPIDEIQETEEAGTGQAPQEPSKWDIYKQKCDCSLRTIKYLSNMLTLQFCKSQLSCCDHQPQKPHRLPSG